MTVGIITLMSFHSEKKKVRYNGVELDGFEYVRVNGWDKGLWWVLVGRWEGGWMHGWMDGWICIGWMDGWVDGRTDG